MVGCRTEEDRGNGRAHAAAIRRPLIRSLPDVAIGQPNRGLEPFAFKEIAAL